MRGDGEFVLSDCRCEVAATGGTIWKSTCPIHAKPPAPPTSGEPPQCKECGEQTGGGEYCYQHTPYTVWSLKDGSFRTNRNGTARVWRDDLPPFSSEALRELMTKCAVADAAITGTVLARMANVEPARLTVNLKAAVQNLLAALEKSDVA